MAKLVACIIVAALLVGCTARYALGSPLSCESVRDADQRNYCRAVSKKQKSHCELIKNSNLRYRCRAEVK